MWELPEIFKEKKIVVFGAGYYGKLVASKLLVNIEFFIDNDPNKLGHINNIPVYNVAHIDGFDKNDLLIIIANQSALDEMAQQLIKHGLVEHRHFIYYTEIMDDPNAKNKIKYLCFESTRKCNSRCIMCDYWKRSNDQEMDFEKFKRLIASPLFKNVEVVNFSGGEPLMLPSIIPYLEEFIKNFKRMKSFSVNSNCLMDKKAIAEFSEINKICEKKNIDFVVSVSIDGTGEVHELQRGIPGSYEKTINCMIKLKDLGIRTQACTTITKNNIWDLEALLSKEKELNLFGIMRVARGTKRFSEEAPYFIEAFSNEEFYQLKLFLYKMSIQGGEHQKRISRMTLGTIEGENRMDILSCPYEKGEATILNRKGEILSCSYLYEPQGIIGDLAIENTEALLNKIDYRLSVAKRTYCHECLEEFYVDWTPLELEKQKEFEFWVEFYSLKKYHQWQNNLEIFETMKEIEEESILITGWYGTETVGDKAILGDIIEKYEKMGFEKIKITSMYPFVTEQTLKELKKEADIIPLYNRQALIEAMSSTYLVIGGGPLMEIEQLGHLLWLSNLSKKAAKKVIIEGCGIGPIRSEEKKQAVVELLQMADEIRLRDAKSCEWALKEAGREAELVDDPAVSYLKNHFNKAKKQEAKKGILACFLREMTTEYNPEMTADDFEKWVEHFEEHLAFNIKRYCDEHQLTPHFYSMHNFVIGNDDRDFNFRFTRKYFSDRAYFVDNKLTSIDTVVNHMQEASKVLCMRFHSVVFADTLGVDYMAIDYTSGGKVKSFAESKQKKAYSIDEIINKNPFV